MLEVWGRRNSINVQKVLWCCEELDLAYCLVEAGGPFGRTADPEYRALNPTGLVPTLVDDGIVVWESNAIVRYLARRHGAGTLWPDDAQTHARAESWMEWQTTVWLRLRPAFIGLIRTPEGERNAARIESAVETTAGHMRLLDSHLAKHDYVAGPEFSMGDIPIGATVSRWLRLDISRPPTPALTAWEKRLAQRRAYTDMVSSIPLS
ncbi:glutathione S-transferase family protein [Salinisphaera aquimarina]|uniref:Glutathione S-transferase family protein n=1 Tax=Salinisphaera aquimarina TaxID=2094031 RepID=A0ABV7EQ16_9GAMM